MLPSPLAATRREISGTAGRLALYEAGSGAPVLLIHSINAAASAYEVRPLFERLSATHRVFAIDLPGYGGSQQGERHYDRWSAYGQSKLANVMTAMELQRRLQAEGSGVLSLAAHPGLARTNLQPASIAMNGSKLEALAYRLIDPLFQSAAMGALPQLYAATAPQASPAGHYGPNQLGGMRGYPTTVPMATTAGNLEQRQRLWEVSEVLGGLKS
jgi:NAD(P)-dependent dehydrogenase (short-subunit alcohol dehydrogenase family)